VINSVDDEKILREDLSFPDQKGVHVVIYLKDSKQMKNRRKKTNKVNTSTT